VGQQHTATLGRPRVERAVSILFVGPFFRVGLQILNSKTTIGIGSAGKWESEDFSSRNETKRGTVVKRSIQIRELFTCIH
jgi:hypothetical protein